MSSRKLEILQSCFDYGKPHHCSLLSLTSNLSLFSRLREILKLYSCFVEITVDLMLRLEMSSKAHEHQKPIKTINIDIEKLLFKNTSFNIYGMSNKNSQLKPVRTKNNNNNNYYNYHYNYSANRIRDGLSSATTDTTSIDNNLFSKSLNIFSCAPKSDSRHCDESLFDSNIFKSVDITELQKDLTKCHLKRKDNEYLFELGNYLILRPLRIGDFDRGYVKVLEQLTIVGNDVTREKFEMKFKHMKSCPQTYYIVVIEDQLRNKIVGTVSLINEQKFIRHASTRCRIEDAVVDFAYRGRHLGKLLIHFAMVLSKSIGCYKVSLECDDGVKTFYEQFGLVLEPNQNYLCKRYDMTRKKPANTDNTSK